MLGRSSYTPEEFEQCESVILAQIQAYKALVRALSTDSKAKDPDAVRREFEWRFFNNLTLVLDRHFVHRIRKVTGKDANPLNEVEMIVESLMNNGGRLLHSNVIKLDPEKTVLGLDVGDAIALTQEDFEKLSTAFLAEIRARFL